MDGPYICWELFQTKIYEKPYTIFSPQRQPKRGAWVSMRALTTRAAYFYRTTFILLLSSSLARA